VEGDAPGELYEKGATSSTMGPQAPVRERANCGAARCGELTGRVSPRRRWIVLTRVDDRYLLATPTAVP